MLPRNSPTATRPDAPTTSPSFCATPLGVFSAEGMADLRRFAEEAERLEYPCIDVGGFIVPGPGPADPLNEPGKELENYGPAAGGAWRGEPAREEAGPAAGARQRPAPPQAAAPGAPPHTVGHRLNHLNLDLPGLADYHPLARVTVSTAEAVFLDVPIGLFHELPIRARLTLEIPLVGRARLSRLHNETRLTEPPFEFKRVMPLPTPVPDVRAWARWEGGALHGQRVESHHRYPDFSICACMTHEWVLGVHPLRDYVAFCALWIGKALHERLLGVYPGRQHYGPWHRVLRDRVNEYCGCGSERRYASCCRTSDRALSAFARWQDALAARRQYLTELRWQGRPAEPPR